MGLHETTQEEKADRFPSMKGGVAAKLEATSNSDMRMLIINIRKRQTVSVQQQQVEITVMITIIPSLSSHKSQNLVGESLLVLAVSLAMQRQNLRHSNEECHQFRILD
jgi:hypothetical protein